ncbi:putative molybdenum carrier protein [Acaryochloris sp. CCMEE 5410]|uniref:putative molybdenum carrier protein n=1 Tax=Acaryochloris sp. CCMEE 5410 TaxID=310037 RepID=UPI0002484BC5|nr:putative molybdenum carrier protein [Acaryochloris sp. CCMEE 5410]
MSVLFQKIVSGGQTGADRAALDWAIVMEIEHGGWCPQGRQAEDGIIPTCYPLQETPSSDYAQRTEWNIRDSDATVIFSLSSFLSGGTLLTQQLAKQIQKPWIHLHAGMGIKNGAVVLHQFVSQFSIKVLNIAGPRQSEEPTIGEFLTQVMNTAFTRNN